MFKTPKGTRDLSPQEARKFQFVIDIVRAVFEKYGFNPLDTPAFEDFKLLSAKSGEMIKDEIYYFKDKSDRELGLRFEFTASLARFISNNPNLPKPFKRYQIGKVWRYDQPQAMRFREFTQADIDIIGSDSLLADLEVLSCFSECLDKLGFRDYCIRINSRKIMEEKLKQFGDIKEIFRSIDKFDKIGEDGVVSELENKKLDAKKIIKIVKELKPEGEIKELFELAKISGLDKKLKFDPSLVRGLEYYTGLVFEVYAGKGLSCGGGGRYDNLIKIIAGPDTPATGISFGVDRLIGLMDELKLFKDVESKKIFIIAVNDDVRSEVVKICSDLRNKGVVCDYDLMNRKMSKQLEYASSQKYPYVLIVGKKELEENKFVLKNMTNRKEEKIELKSINSFLSTLR